MKRLSLRIFFVWILITCSLNGLQAEIISLTIKWTGLLCQEACVKQLEQQFKKIPGVDSFVISGAAGQINVVWKPNASFSFTPINTAMRMVGLSPLDIRLKVRGKLRHDARSVTLVSDGDYTRFNLLNPVLPEMNRQAAEFNLAARALTPPLRQKLLDAEAADMTATIEGVLFMPMRTPGLNLVVEQLNFTAPPKKG